MSFLVSNEILILIFQLYPLINTPNLLCLSHCINDNLNTVITNNDSLVKNLFSLFHLSYFLNMCKSVKYETYFGTKGVLFVTIKKGDYWNKFGSTPKILKF